MWGTEAGDGEIIANIVTTRVSAIAWNDFLIGFRAQ
jgi:hypothetical protein